MASNNTNSLYNKYSRYIAGGVTETSNNRLEWWERTNFISDPTDIEYTVETFYENRLDLIATVFLDEPRYWWLIAQYNNILDPFSEVSAGRKLIIPSKERLPLMLLTRQGGIASTKQQVNTISPIII